MGRVFSGLCMIFMITQLGTVFMSSLLVAWTFSEFFTMDMFVLVSRWAVRNETRELRLENSAEISKRFVSFAFLHLVCIEVHPFVGQSSSFSQLFCRRHRTELRFADHKEHLGHRQSPNRFRCSD